MLSYFTLGLNLDFRARASNDLEALNIGTAAASVNLALGKLGIRDNPSESLTLRRAPGANHAQRGQQQTCHMRLTFGSP